MQVVIDQRIGLSRMDTKKINLLYKAECHVCKLSSQFSTTLSKNYLYFDGGGFFFLVTSWRIRFRICRTGFKPFLRPVSLDFLFPAVKWTKRSTSKRIAVIYSSALPKWFSVLRIWTIFPIIKTKAIVNIGRLWFYLVFAVLFSALWR